MNKKLHNLSEINGDTIVSLAMLMFGAYALFLRFFPNIPTLAFLFSFQVIGAIAFFLIVRRQGFPKLQNVEWPLLLGLAVTATLNDLCYFFAFRLTSVSNAAIAHQMVSAFLLIFAPLFLHEKTKKDEWVALAIALAGIIIIYGNDVTTAQSRDFWGITLGLASAFFYGLVIVLYRHIPRRDISVSAINFWRYAISTVLLLPIMFSLDGFNVESIDIIPLIVFGIFFAFIAAGIHTYGISKSRSLHVSIIGKSEPVIASFYALIFLKEAPSPQTILGGVLIIGASLWLALRTKN